MGDSKSQRCHKVNMSAFQIVAVACLFAIGAHALVTPHGYIEKMELYDTDYTDTLKGLDVVGNDDQISEQDLAIHYYHPKVAHNKKRFIEWIDSKADADKMVNAGELKTFMQKKTVKLACHECSYIKSQSLRAKCFADQILTYVALCADYKTVNNFFNKIEKPDDNDKEIDLAEMNAYLTSIGASNDLDFSEDDVKNMMIEIGGSDSKITATEWREYITQEELHDDFRVCRTKLVQETCEVDYDHACMIKELLFWCMTGYTERDIEETFHVFDTKGDGYIEASEIENGFPGADEELKSRFIKMMDKAIPADGKISYAEFRLFNRDHWVQLEMERHCSSLKKTQAEEVECYVGKLKELVVENHHSIWLRHPDLDMAITFEHLDTNGNGRIEKDEDLGTWDAKAANNFISEMDGPDKNVHVSLEEFNEAVDEPNMVYAISDCLDHVLGDKPKRTECFVGELQSLLKDILTKDAVEAFFLHYDTNKCGRITLDEVKAHDGITDEQATNFMREMAMGDQTVNKREFAWYVKQQRITKMFTVNKCGSEKTTLHTWLIHYHDNVFTEYDTQQVFKTLDTDKDWELTDKDCAGHDPLKHRNLLQKMDKPDDVDNTVNFVEYWLYMNTPRGDEPRKIQLETKCTTQLHTQDEEMTCYLEHIWDVK